jgi:acyl-CoA oxidase
VHRLVLEAFTSAVEDCRDEGTARLLGAVCDLYVLSEIEGDRGWFLEHGRLTPAASKAVTRAVDDLCRELRQHVGSLVAGLGVPTSWLGAEITGASAPGSATARMAG